MDFRLATLINFDMLFRIASHKLDWSMKFKGINWKSLATIAGIGLIALALVDAGLHWYGGNEAMASFGSGVNARVTGESIFAFLLVGMIVGMVFGIGMAFSYFMWKERKLESQPDELTKLLDEMSREDCLFVDERYESRENDDKGDALEPWERPSDWWKRDDDN